MKAFVVRRLLSLFPVALTVGVVVFFLIHLVPGDPAAHILGPNATDEQIQEVRALLGLEDPLPVQFGRWFFRVLKGDLGESIFLRHPALQVILERLEPTGMLTLLATLFAVVVSLPLGVLAAVRRNTVVDQAIMTVALLGMAMPSFWLGLNLILLFAVHFRWFPVAGYMSVADAGVQALRWLVLPSVALGFIEAGLLTRMTRATVLEVLGQDFVRTARAKGLHEWAVLFKHALKNALLPIVTVLGNSIAAFLGGAAVIETVFGIPGVGRLVVQAVLRRDYPLLQAIVLFMAGVYVIVNFLIDLLYVRIDPRIRYV